MSLEALQAEVEGCRTAAAELSEEFSRAHSEIEADPSLTTTGKRERLEPLHAAAVEKIAALRTREKTAVKAEKEKLERRVFGLSPSASTDPASIVSFRDAQSRARELEDGDDAEEIYQSALRSGDKIMATAVLEKALVRGWTSIKEDYLQRNTTTRDDLDDLAALAKYSNNGLANSVHYMPPSLNLPHSAGMPNVPPLATRREPQGVPNLGDYMSRLLGLSK
ncbi:hypothetical protein ACXPWS_13560 [Mycobacterium sp. BMJ-28]